MNKNGVIAVVVVVTGVILVGLWALRAGSQPYGEGCSGPPPMPTGISYTKAGDIATLHWTPVDPKENVTVYIVEVGSTPGGNHHGAVVAPATATSLSRQTPPGTYYVHMYARNACGTSAPTADVTVVMP